MFDCVLGLGQGGSRIAASFQERFDIPAAYFNFAVVDFSKFMGRGIKHVINTEGTGRDPNIGRKYAKEHRNKIASQISKFVERVEKAKELKNVLVTVGGGGGSGCGFLTVILPFLVKKKINILLIYTLPEKREKLPAKPNALRVLNWIIEKYIKTGDISVMLVDNEFSANKYVSDSFRFGRINKVLPQAFNRFLKITNLYERHRYIDFNTGYSALDFRELNRVLFYSKGFLDIRIFSLDDDSVRMEDNELRKTIRTSSLFVGSFDINTSKISLVSIAIPERLRSSAMDKFVDRLLTIIGKMTRSPQIFNSSYYDKTIRKITANILLGGLVKSKSLDSLIRQATKDKELLDNKGEIEQLDLSEL